MKAVKALADVKAAFSAAAAAVGVGGHFLQMVKV